MEYSQFEAIKELSLMYHRGALDDDTFNTSVILLLKLYFDIKEQKMIVTLA